MIAIWIRVLHGYDHSTVIMATVCAVQQAHCNNMRLKGQPYSSVMQPTIWAACQSLPKARIAHNPSKAAPHGEGLKLGAVAL